VGGGSHRPDGLALTPVNEEQGRRGSRRVSPILSAINSIGVDGHQGTHTAMGPAWTPGRSRVFRSRGRSALHQIPVDEGDCHGAFADRRGKALDRPMTHVSGGEDARDVGFQIIRLAIEPPGAMSNKYRRGIRCVNRPTVSVSASVVAWAKPSVAWTGLVVNTVVAMRTALTGFLICRDPSNFI
jgi:hypothetical protein